MTEILSLLSGGWSYVIAACAALVAVGAAWFTGKKIGSTETQAKADVSTAQEQTKQAQQVTQKQTEIVKVVKDVEQKANSDTDSAARSRMQQSKYHSED